MRLAASPVGTCWRKQIRQRSATTGQTLSAAIASGPQHWTLRPPSRDVARGSRPVRGAQSSRRRPRIVRWLVCRWTSHDTTRLLLRERARKRRGATVARVAATAVIRDSARVCGCRCTPGHARCRRFLFVEVRVGTEVAASVCGQLARWAVSWSASHGVATHAVKSGSPANRASVWSAPLLAAGVPAVAMTA